MYLEDRRRLNSVFNGAMEAWRQRQSVKEIGKLRTLSIGHNLKNVNWKSDIEIYK